MADNGQPWRRRRWWWRHWATREMAHGVADTTSGISKAFGNEVDMTVECVGNTVDLVSAVLVGNA